MPAQISPDDHKRDVIEAFAVRHHIPTERITGHEIEAVYWLEHSQTIIAVDFSSHAERLTSEPTWRLSQAMLDRVYEYTSASLLLFIVGQHSSAEVVARTTTEAAINVLYVLSGNRVERLWHYCTSYIATERHQNKLWRDAIKGYGDEDRKAHIAGIAQKENALSLYETFLDTAFRQMGFSPEGIASWPGLFDRFKSLGKEDSYRTVYAAMCSQAHNDAEDLLNKFVIHGAGHHELQDTLKREETNFSRMLVHFGLQYYLEASWRYARAFGLKTAEKEIREGHKVVSRLVEAIVEDLRPS